MTRKISKFMILQIFHHTTSNSSQLYLNYICVENPRAMRRWLTRLCQPSQQRLHCWPRATRLRSSRPTASSHSFCFSPNNNNNCCLRITKPNRHVRPTQWRYQQGSPREVGSPINRSRIKLHTPGLKISLLTQTLALLVSPFLANVSSVVETVTYRRIAEQASVKSVVARDI